MNASFGTQTKFLFRNSRIVIYILLSFIYLFNLISIHIFSPGLLEELKDTVSPLTPKLNVDAAKKSDLEKIEMSEKIFR